MPYFLTKTQLWIHSQFITDNQLRPFWRFLSAGLLCQLLYLVSSSVVVQGASIFGWAPSLYPRMFFSSLLHLPLLLLLFKAFTMLFENRPLGAIGIHLHPRWIKEFGVGITLGLLLITVSVALQLAVGLAEIHFNFHVSLELLLSGVFFAFLFLISSVNEELTFRGYPFQRLVGSIGMVGAIIILSVLFGFIHWSNPHHTWISTINTVLIGIGFCIAYIRTRGLWLPTGLHFSWNLSQGFLFGIPVSGYELPISLVQIKFKGPEYLTGGAYGIEGSLIATVVILLLLAYLKNSKRFYVEENMKVLLGGEDSSFK